MTEQKQLRDYAIDENINTFALLKSVEARVTNSGKPYLAITVADRSMEISGMKWDSTEEEFKNLHAGEVVAVSGVRQEYRDKPQLKIFEVRPTTLGEPNNPADYMAAGPMKAKEMEEEVNSLLFQIVNPTWQRIVRYLLNEYHEKFFTYPAAKSNHHAFAGGLGFHTLSIARLAMSVSKQYDNVDASLLLAGALLHDLGKVLELSGPIATVYTVPGNLIGHIVLIDEQIVLAAKELNLDLFSEDMIVLRHVVLAHHGQLEFGSPVRPLIKEANILHQLDELDANIQSFDNALKDTEPGEFSARAWALDNRAVYKPTEK
ncbi:MAG: HD domain-containing protein [Lactobacillaceae bacterium]|jgi:3'-5' exoribonuclease|nr:HD domain-containing protein [Lactobacillaceae bacterium]